MKRLLYILTHSKMQVVRLTLAIGSLLWAIQLFMTPQIFPTAAQIAAGTGRQTYALMATIAPEEVWAALFLVNGVWTMYSLMSGVTNRVTLAMDGFLGCVLWTASTTSCYLAYWPHGLGLWGSLMAYPSPAAMSGDVALSLMAWWHMIRLWALDQPKDSRGGTGADY